MFGIVKRILSKRIEIELEDDFDIDRVTKYADGKQPIVEIIIADGREISPEQRKKIYALLGDMAKFTGYDPEDMKIIMKYKYLEKTGGQFFSLSSCSMTIANEFIEFLIDFALGNRIPFKTEIWDGLPNDFLRSTLCLKYRQCAICGKEHSDIDHFYAVGNRSKKVTDHRKFYYECLCREHHNEKHNLGAMSFYQKYHIKPVQLSEDDLIRYHIMTRKRMNEIDERNEISVE